MKLLNVKHPNTKEATIMEKKAYLEPTILQRNEVIPKQFLLIPLT